MAYQSIGFIGLGVMGEPICRNLVKKSGAGVIVFENAGFDFRMPVEIRAMTKHGVIAGDASKV